ncbi:unnamed protein product [Alopecurus aequalis]
MTQARFRQCRHGGLLSSGRRDWANLTTDLVREIAGRLCSGSPCSASQYNRLRAVCKTWRESTDDPRSVCSLDIRFRPTGWTPICHLVPTSRCRFRHVSGLRASVNLDALSSNYIFAMAEGLLLLRDKQSTDIARLLNPLTGGLTEFPPITEVRAYDGSEPKSRQAIDTLKLYFSEPNVFDDFVGIDDWTSPPTLVFCVQNNGPLHVIYAKPVPMSRCRFLHVSGLRASVNLDLLSSNYIFAVAEGLLIVRDKVSADIVRLLNPLTGGLTEFPPTTEVRAYDGSEPKSRQAIDTLKLYFSEPNVFDDFAGINDSTSPPVFCVQNNGPLHVVYAKPGDHHWVSVHNPARWAHRSDNERLAWYFTPPPGVCMPRKIYVYSLDLY